MKENRPVNFRNRTRWPVSLLLAPLLAYCPAIISAAGAQAEKQPAGSTQSASSAARVASSAKSAPTKQKCAVAYETAQEHRASGALTDTRSELKICANSQCPRFVQNDCKRWLSEVEKELPSFTIILVTSAGEHATDAIVELDDKQLSPDTLKGSIAVDPGPHQLVIRGANDLVTSRHLLAQQGVQNREIRVVIEAPAYPGNSSTSMEVPNSSSLKPYAYASWGLGAIGLGVFGILGHMGRTDENALRDECENTGAKLLPPGCGKAETNQRVSDYQALQTFADIGLYTGLAAIVGGTALFFLDSDPSETAESGSLSWGVTPLQDGAFASVIGRF